MLKSFIRLTICLVLLFCGSRSFAQHYVHDRPNRPQHDEHRPPAPKAGAVWIDEDWKWSGGAYTNSGGHWATPPHSHDHWVAGSWTHSHQGYRWTAGRWSH